VAEGIKPLPTAIAVGRARHVKRGTHYDLFAASARVQCSRPIEEGDRVAVYRAEDGTWWVRPVREFSDGRFDVDLE